MDDLIRDQMEKADHLAPLLDDLIEDRPKRGAPFGNTNAVGNTSALKHGLYAVKNRHGVTLAKLPGKTGYITRRLDRLRAVLEDATLTMAGAVGPAEILAINSVCRCEQVCQYLAHVLRTKVDELSVDQQIMILKDIASHTLKRDVAMKSLGLGLVNVDGDSSTAEERESAKPPRSRVRKAKAEVEGSAHGVVEAAAATMAQEGLEGLTIDVDGVSGGESPNTTDTPPHSPNGQARNE